MAHNEVSIKALLSELRHPTFLLHWLREDVVYISDLEKVHALWEECVHEMAEWLMVYLQHWHPACQDPSVAFDVKHTERPWVILISSEDRNQKGRMVDQGSEGWASGVWMVKTDRGPWLGGGGALRRWSLPQQGVPAVLIFPFLSCVCLLLPWVWPCLPKP